MAFYRAYEVELPASFAVECGLMVPKSLEDGSGHEFLYFYGPFKLGYETELPSAAPSSGSAPAANSSQVGVMK
jgi:hypothetical protein